MARRAGNRPRRPHRHPHAVRQLCAVRRNPVDPGCRCGIRTRRRRRPRRARRAGLRRGRRRRHHHRSAACVRGHGFVPRLACGTPARPRRRLDHLHLRVHRNPEGCRGDAPQRGGIRRRRGADLPAGQPARAERSCARRPVRGVRRVVRRDVAGVAPRRMPGSGAALVGPQRDGPGAVVGVPRHHRRLDGADAGRAVAGRGPRGGPAAHLRRRGLPAGARRAAGRRSRSWAARCGTRTGRPRRPSSRAWRSSMASRR